MNQSTRSLLLQGAAAFGVALSPPQLDAFGYYAAELKKWNRKINLTAITGDEEIVIKHFVDSLSICPIVAGAGSVLDLGSGGGFPVIPLKVVDANIEALSVDAVEKKIIFQRHVGRLLGLSGFTALHARGEELAGRFAGRFDWVVSRAFADIPTFVRMALPLCAADGKILAMKGQAGRAEVEAAQGELTGLGVKVVELIEFTLPRSTAQRSLVIIGKNQ